MENNWISIIPFLVVIPVAMISKKVLPAIILGLLAGSYLYNPHIIGGIETAINFIIDGLTDKINLQIVLFLYIFTGMVGMMKITGGIKGFVKWSAEHVHTKKQSLFLIWISTLGTFSSPTFRIVTIGPIMRALSSKVKIPAQELGYAIETTGTALISLIPVATAFVGFMTSIIELSLNNENVAGNAYTFFLQSIPYNFFSLAIIVIGFYLSFLHHDNKSVSTTSSPENHKQAEAKGWEDCHPVVAKELPTHPLNLIVPLLVDIFLTMLLTGLSGVNNGGVGIVESLIKGDVLSSMLVALIITVLFAFIYYGIQHFSLDKLISSFINGGNNLMSVIILLSAIWGLTNVTNQLGFSTFISNNLFWIPKSLILPVLFVSGCFISYFIGSSFGTWGLLMPLGISMGHTSGIALPIIIGSVFASGVFGTFASPLSDDTNTMAGILDLKAVSYARYKFKSAAIAAVISAVGYLIVSIVY